MIKVVLLNPAVYLIPSMFVQTSNSVFKITASGSITFSIARKKKANRPKTPKKIMTFVTSVPWFSAGNLQTLGCIKERGRGGGGSPQMLSSLWTVTVRPEDVGPLHSSIKHHLCYSLGTFR